MSKSKKKQAARRRDGQNPAPVDPLTVQPLATDGPNEALFEVTLPGDDDDWDGDDEPALAMPTRQAQPLNEALYDQAIAAATYHGQMREEGDAVAYLYNGETLSMKFAEGAEGTDEPDRLMIAAFRQGVVFQVEGGVQTAYQAGAWEQEIARLAHPVPADPLADDELPGEEA